MKKKIQLINGIIMYIKLLQKACYNAFVYKNKKSKNKTKKFAKTFKNVLKSAN